MRNGCKNYSIADLDSTDASNQFTMMKNSSVSGADGAVISVKNAQAMFVLSLITQNGLGVSANGTYANGGYTSGTYKDQVKYDGTNALNAYALWMATHHAEYKNIGKDGISDTDADYLLAREDTCSGVADTVPYLIKNYTPKAAGGSYPAFNLTNENRYYYMTLDGSENAYYLPDGYRGIGSLLFTSVNATQSSADPKNYSLHLYGLDGNEKLMSLNMNLYLYDSVGSADNYGPPKGNDSGFVIGAGLFDELRGKYIQGDESSKLKDLIISGTVKYEIVSTSGTALNRNPDVNGIPSVGGFMGAAGNNDPNDYYIENLSLNNLEISGCRFTGGIIGGVNIGEFNSKIKHTLNIGGCSAQNLSVYSVGYAGGMLGIVWNTYAEIQIEFAEDSEFIIVSNYRKEDFVTTKTETEDEE